MVLQAIGRLVQGRRRPARASSAVPGLDEIGREFPTYRRTFIFRGDFIDDAHKAIAALPVDGALIRDAVPGFLRPADALALYEHAYFARGDVLEMGSAWGLSATILGRALRNSGRRARVTSLEIAPEFHSATANAVAEAGLSDRHEGILGDAGAEADRLIARGRGFGFAFVDHDHAYVPTRRAGEQLRVLLEPGGYALFHDFNDERNRSDPADYGVHRAVDELARGPHFDFVGTIGCCALLRRSLA